MPEALREQAEQLHIQEKSLAVRKQEEAEHAREGAKANLLGAGIWLWIVWERVGFNFQPVKASGLECQFRITCPEKQETNKKKVSPN